MNIDKLKEVVNKVQIAVRVTGATALLYTVVKEIKEDI